MCYLRPHSAVIPPGLLINKQSYKTQILSETPSSIVCVYSLLSPFHFIFLLSSLNENNLYLVILVLIHFFLEVNNSCKIGSNFFLKYLAGQLIFILKSCLESFFPFLLVWTDFISNCNTKIPPFPGLQANVPLESIPQAFELSLKHYACMVIRFIPKGIIFQVFLRGPSRGLPLFLFAMYWPPCHS